MRNIWTDDLSLRKNCIEGTEAHRRALARAGYDVPDTTLTAIEAVKHDSLEAIKIAAAEYDADVDVLMARLENLKAPASAGLGHRIARAVAKHHNITFNQLRSATRFREYVRARQHAMYEIKKMTDLSYPAIGRIIGDRDHSTIIHGIRSHVARIEKGEYPK